MTVGDGDEKSNTVLYVVRWIWNRLFKKQGREEQPSVMQSVHELKTDGTNSPNIIAGGDVTVNIGTAAKPQRESVLKQIWHNPQSNDGSIAPIRAESIETNKLS